MTTSNSTFRKVLFGAGAIIFLTLPTSAFAAVRITDAMYDPAGADAGHEWIEIANQGSESADLYGYRLFEGGTNHRLTVAAGTSTLAAGESAVIVTDPMQYALEHPSFAGTVFKSSFSLSNAGETIELKDAKLNVVDTYSYTAPPAVKAAPAKSPSKKSAAKPKGVISKTAASTEVPYYAAGNQAAAHTVAPPNAAPALPVWSYGLGLAALLLIGMGAVLYARPVQSFKIETSPTEEEFELVD